MHGVLALAMGAWNALAGVSFAALAVAVALHVAKLAAEARAWHWIVSHAHAEHDVRFRTTCAAFVGSIGVNAVLPARVGEALRVGVVRRRLPGSSVVTIAATIVLETGIEVAFGVAVIGAVVVGGRSFASGVTMPGLVSHPVGLAVLTGLAVLGAGTGLVLRERARALLARMAAGFSILRSPRAFAARVLSWKLVAWALRLGSVYAFLLAFNVPAAPWTAIVVVAAQSVAASIPLLPGNAGTQQAAIGVALAGSASAASLLGFGVGMQAATTGADLVLGAVALAVVGSRRDLTAALATLRPRRRVRPVGAGA